MIHTDFSLHGVSFVDLPNNILHIFIRHEYDSISDARNSKQKKIRKKNEIVYLGYWIDNLVTSHLFAKVIFCYKRCWKWNKTHIKTCVRIRWTDINIAVLDMLPLPRTIEWGQISSTKLLNTCKPTYKIGRKQHTFFL